MSENKVAYQVSKKVRVWDKGQFTIPAIFRENLDINQGDILNVTQVGHAIVAIPDKLKTGEMASAVQEGLRREGIDLKQLMAELREGQHEYEAD
jgi:AbrB family looped-hinge helix DNA binding protein